MPTSRSLTIAVLFLTVGAAICACDQQPAKAPGSNPQDMTPAGHEAAAQKEQTEAAEHKRMQENVSPGKPSVETSQKQEHGAMAEKHEDFAQQHQNAAGATRDGGAAR